MEASSRLFYYFCFRLAAEIELACVLLSLTVAVLTMRVLVRLCLVN
jgi:hypothetical protein